MHCQEAHGVFTMCSTKMFQKIGESMKNALSGDGELAEYHHAFLVDKKIWLFSKTFKKQPTYHWGHWVMHVGGYALNFDLTSHKWSKKLKFDALADDENMEEVLFTLKGQIYVVLYRSFGKIEFIKCFRWGAESETWLSIQFSIDESNTLKADEPDRSCGLFVVDQDSSHVDSILFASFVNEIITLHEIAINGDEAELLGARKLDMDVYSGLRKPVLGARWNNNVYIMSGVQGCGFRFQPDSALRYDYATAKTDMIEIAGKQPPFDFAGAGHTALLPTGHWIHATGSVARGMTDSRFCGEIWELNLNSTSLKWDESAVLVPELDREELCLAISDDRRIYAFDHSSDLILSHF